MHGEESELQESCSVCGADLLEGAEASFAFGVSGLLCFGCALERGGRYDAATERWVDAPDVSGLFDEKYGSSPGERRRT